MKSRVGGDYSLLKKRAATKRLIFVKTNPIQGIIEL